MRALALLTLVPASLTTTLRQSEGSGRRHTDPSSAEAVVTAPAVWPPPPPCQAERGHQGPPAVFWGRRRSAPPLPPEVGRHRTDTSTTVFLKSSLKEINDFLQPVLSDLGLGIDKFICWGTGSPFFSQRHL